MTDDTQTPQTPQTPAPAEQPTTPAPRPTAPEVPPPNFGEQAAAKGATLPPDLAKRIEKITKGG